MDLGREGKEQAEGPVKEKIWKQVGFLTQLLIFSGALNICFFATFLHSTFQSAQEEPQYINKPVSVEKGAVSVEEAFSNRQLLKQFLAMSYDQLLLNLENSGVVEDGYTKRDLALAVLVKKYHFNLEAALFGASLQRRLYFYGEDRENHEESLLFYPGLTDQHYQKLDYFLRTERWPFTSQGIFLRLKEVGLNKAASLEESFYQTSEFSNVELLFGRADIELSKKQLLSLLLDGDWQMLADFTEQQQLSQDLSLPHQEAFLLGYLMRKSRSAAYLLLALNSREISRKLDDESALIMLELLDIKTASAERFVLELLTSPRSDAIWKMSARRLYAWENEELSEPYDHMAALARFLPEEFLNDRVKEENLISVNSSRAEEVGKRVEEVEVDPLFYTVVKGDSLWRIAEKFGVSVDALIEHNNLSTDLIIPGKRLEIPSREGVKR